MSHGWIVFVGLVTYLLVGGFFGGLIGADSDDFGEVICCVLFWPIIGSVTLGEHVARRIERREEERKNVALARATAREKQS